MKSDAQNAEVMGKHEIVDQIAQNQSIRERTDEELEGVQLDSPDHEDPYPQQQAWYLDDFDLRSSADGRQFLSPKRTFVDALILSAPKRMDRAYELLTADDRATCEEIANIIRDAAALLGGIDTYQGEQLPKHFTLQAARQAARAASLRHSAVKWNARLKPGQEAPEKLTNLVQMVGNTGKTGAIMLHVARQLTPTLKVDYRQACWETARMNAYKIQQTVIDPKAAGNHEQSASSALLDAC